MRFASLNASYERTRPQTKKAALWAALPIPA